MSRKSLRPVFDGLLEPGKPAPKADRADENAALRKVVGERFVEARRINGFDQSEARKRLGYSNSTQLSLIESGDRMPPHTLMVTASTVYGVSMDFLYGISDEPERDPKAAERHAAMRHVNALVGSTTQTMIGLLMQYLAQGGPSIRTAEALVTRAESLVEEVRNLRKLQPKLFDERLRGAARLLKLADDTEAAAAGAREMLERHERMMDFKRRQEERRTGATHPLLDALDAQAAAQTVGSRH